MNYPKHHHSRKKRPERSGRSPYNGKLPYNSRSPYNGRSHHNGRKPNPRALANPESTGTESTYMKSLVDTRAVVTVTMMDGETFRGHIRYYDRYCFSIGLLSEKRKIFLRKENVSHITEEPSEADAGPPENAV